ncbi:MAG: aldo/keto reductase, partial [Bacteroidia bacterium]
MVIEPGHLPIRDLSMKLTQKKALGSTGLSLPQVVYGTSYLGNIYTALSFDEKLALIRKWFECTEKPVVIDTAGKYGAGLALEVIGEGLAQLGVRPEEVVISNKLGWYRVPLTTEEPTFESGVWVDLQNDCIQTFGYEEILKCFIQGNELLGGTYRSEVVSIHDPDEYLLAVIDPADRDQRFMKLLES